MAQWDAFTIEREPITSIDLMERAATKCVLWLLQQFAAGHTFHVYCGKGNNGGDGLAIARMLHQRGFAVEVYILETGTLGSPDFQANLQRLHQWKVPFHFLQKEQAPGAANKEAIIIDALFGSGLNRPLEGLAAAVVESINVSQGMVVSIDVPSGMLLDGASVGKPVVSAHFTLSFGATKAAFLLPENEERAGKIVVLDIGLHPQFDAPAPYELLDGPFIKKLLQPRSKFSHKGTFGHGLIIGGSYGKIGATVLATRALLRSGAGLATVYIPKCGYTVLQTAAPEAMVLTDEGVECITELAVTGNRFSAIGIGPGMGTLEATLKAFTQFIESNNTPLVLDADALNLLAMKPYLLQKLPPHSILTPHPKEFERLFGACANDFDRIKMAQQQAAALGLIILLKGHHSFIAAPDGPGYFNSTGNAGMATGGSGDVLTGLITGLLAQGYTALHATLVGVYLHGLAGDFAAARLSQEAMIAGDLVQHFGVAFRKIGS
jgi:NAD(P)H-hydrate epimerase